MKKLSIIGYRLLAIGCLWLAMGITASAATNKYNFGGQGFGYGHGAVKPANSGLTFTNAGVRDLTVSVGQLCGVDPESGAIITNAGNLLPLKARSLTVTGTIDPRPAAGTMRWTGRDFEGYNGSNWISFTTGRTNIWPMARNDAAQTLTNTACIINVLANDTGDGISVASVTQPANGTVLNRGTNVVYTPALNFMGTNRFNYVLGSLYGSATAQVTIVVRATPPLARNDAAQTLTNTPCVINVLANDTGEDLTVASVTQPANGTVLNRGTNVVYTPALNFMGTNRFNYVLGSLYGSATGQVTVVVRGNTTPPTNTLSGMVLIPAGSFQMGDALDGNSGAPVHTVTVSAFYMDPYEVTKAKWDEVYTWATSHGYGFDNAGSGKGTNHPVHTINWWDCVKWANARSEKEGLTPCYTVTGVVYRTGQSAPDCNWTASGYRLPTEAEWEKAARGGAVGRRFPWSDSDTIQHARANYYASPWYAYDTSPTQGYHPTYNDGVYPYTSPVGVFAANGYGLYDMAGNVWEWCWDWYDTYVSGTDPRGPGSGSVRVVRGGGWYNDASYCRVAYRGYNWPGSTFNGVGFRLLRTAL